MGSSVFGSSAIGLEVATGLRAGGIGRRALNWQAAPVFYFSPAGQRESGRGVRFFDPVDALAAGVPRQVQVGGEMQAGLQHGGVGLEFKGRDGGGGGF